LPRIRATLHAQAARIPWRTRMRQALDEMRRKFHRMRQPTGLHIVFLGPDGSGKSSVIEACMREMAQAFRRIEYRHLKPGPQRGHSAKPVTDPHAQSRRGLLSSTAKILHFWTTYLVGCLLWLYPRYLRSTLLVFDRYYHDLLADPARYRYGGSLRFARLLGRLLPQPDLVFILDAPAEVLQSRKQEVSFDESVRQRTAYRSLRSEYSRAYIIDASEPLDKVVTSVLAHIVAFMEQRTAKRLGLARNADRGYKLCKP
jgi:thymidylate kinase